MMEYIMGILKLILSLPQWIILLVPKIFVAILNIFPCPWACVCCEETFFQYRPYFANSVPVQYVIQSQEVLRLGHSVVAYLRGYCYKRTLRQVEKISVGPMELEEDHRIIEEFIKRSIDKNQLREIISVCKILI